MSATASSSQADTAGTSRPKAAAAARPVRKRGERGPLASIGLHGALLTATAIALFPALWIAFISFGPTNAWTDPGEILHHLSLRNYRTILHTNFPKWFLNSVIVAAATTVVGVMLSASAGYAISRMRFPGHKQLMWTFLTTQMFPMAVLIVPLYNLLGRLGLLDSYAGLVLTYCTISVPFCAWMLKGYFDTIPHEIDEAGRIDGLTPFGTFWRLILPLARPGLAVTAFYSFLTAWGEVAYASKFMTSNENYTLAVGIGTYVTEQRAQWGSLTAAAVIIAIPAALVFFVVQRHLVSGLTAGAAKS